MHFQPGLILVVTPTSEGLNKDRHFQPSLIFVVMPTSEGLQQD